MKNKFATLALSGTAIAALGMILFAGVFKPVTQDLAEQVAEQTAEQTTSETEALTQGTVCGKTTDTMLPVETTFSDADVTEASNSNKSDMKDVVVTTVVVTEQPAEEAPIRSDIIELDGVTYVQGLMIINKTYPLPPDYNPTKLTPDTSAAFADLQRAAAADGYTMKCVSGFRSFERQTTIYNGFVNRDGKSVADTYSARPGHSEHQSGLALDVNCSGTAFDDTPEAKWLEEHCWEYGFIIRYPHGKEKITGYEYESSHIRYVGKEWAKKIHESGLCLEEYLDIPSEYRK